MFIIVLLLTDFGRITDIHQLRVVIFIIPLWSFY